ncbi:hypothetical protein OC842_003763 [Tilletia horrida]|uniref:F-box domain-containing protein n=1 Tax=Tilletia horrida TaxID=155126 RepID=A0AAN6GD15_9BASI|nr:hypothetical protein OC842_003763 [Tilletia horrida]
MDDVLPSTMDVDIPPSPSHALQVSEILNHTFAHLAREQVDLVELSLVSKQFRSVALPLLVRDLDVALSRVPDFVKLFEANQHLRQYNLKIEKKYRSSRSSNATRENHDNADSRWYPVEDLMRVLSNQLTRKVPPLDVTFGIRSMFALHTWIENHPPIRPTTAFRVIADHDREPRTAEHLIEWNQSSPSIPATSLTCSQEIQPRGTSRAPAAAPSLLPCEDLCGW